MKLEDVEERLKELRRDIDDTNIYAVRNVGKIETEMLFHRVLLLGVLIVSVILLLSR